MKKTMFEGKGTQKDSNLKDTKGEEVGIKGSEHKVLKR